MIGVVVVKEDMNKIEIQSINEAYLMGRHHAIDEFKTILLEINNHYQLTNDNLESVVDQIVEQLY